MPSDPSENGANGDYSTYQVSSVSKNNFTAIFKYNALHNQINSILDAYLTDGLILRASFGSFGHGNEGSSKKPYPSAFSPFGDPNGSKLKTFTPSTCLKLNSLALPEFRKMIDLICKKSNIDPTSFCTRPTIKIDAAMDRLKKEDYSVCDKIKVLADHPVRSLEELEGDEDFRVKCTVGATLTCSTEEELFTTVATALSCLTGIMKLENFFITPKWSGARFINMIIMVSNVPCNLQIHFAPLIICSAGIEECADYFGSMFEDMKEVDVKKKLTAFERMGEMPEQKDVQETLRMILAGTDKQKMDAIVQITGG